jgi:prophage antirepressor-like protein
MDDGKPYFPATECAVILGYKNPRKAILDHCKGVTKRDSLSAEGVQSRNLFLKATFTV